MEGGRGSPRLGQCVAFTGPVGLNFSDFGFFFFFAVCVVERQPEGPDGGGPAWVSTFSAWGSRGLIFDGVTPRRGGDAVKGHVGSRSKGWGGLRGGGGGSRGRGVMAAAPWGCWRGLGWGLGGPRSSLGDGGPLSWDESWVGWGLMGVVLLELTLSVGVLGHQLTGGDLRAMVLWCCPVGGHLGEPGYEVSLKVTLSMGVLGHQLTGGDLRAKVLWCCPIRGHPGDKVMRYP